MKNIEYGDKTYENLTVLTDKILIKKLINDDFRCEDGIFVPQSNEHKNERLGVGKVLECTAEATEKLGISAGDYVFYDYFSAHGDWKENIITNGENILMKLTEKEAMDFLNGSLQV